MGGNIIQDVIPESQAHKAGISIGWTIISVNGKTQPKDDDAILQVISKAQKEKKTIAILFQKNAFSLDDYGSTATNTSTTYSMDDDYRTSTSIYSFDSYDYTSTSTSTSTYNSYDHYSTSTSTSTSTTTETFEATESLKDDLMTSTIPEIGSQSPTKSYDEKNLQTWRIPADP